MKNDPSPLVGQRPPDWWSRNWKWFVPVICVAGLIAIVGFLGMVLGFMRSSDAYVGAVARAKAAPAVMDVLGTPIKEGFFFTGNVSVNGPSGRADLMIPIEGPKAAATVYVVATKAAGAWHFHQLVILVQGTKQVIDLSDQPPKPAAVPAPG